jgi:hypothetical protein
MCTAQNLKELVPLPHKEESQYTQLGYKIKFLKATVCTISGG